MFKLFALIVVACMLLGSATVWNTVRAVTQTTPSAQTAPPPPPITVDHAPAPTTVPPAPRGFRSPLSYTVGEVLTAGLNAAAKIASTGAAVIRASTAQADSTPPR